ncbi:kinesin family member 15 [Pancytospora epiphaga]|nr:kinesin family member 15 [Pancytospora epiphaga]
MNDNIVTYIRIKGCDRNPEFEKNHIRVNTKLYHADVVQYGPDQDALFRSIQSKILEKCVQGYNCSIFAYGQTGSGKTYTIEGTEESPGLVQRSLAFLHDTYPEVRLSFIEIYNENATDLVDPERLISIRDDPQNGVTVDNLSIRTTDSLEKSLDLYRRGIANRKHTATTMNENSSRSHSIFTILLEYRDKNIVKRSKLCFVDLAGSERCRESESDRIKETCNINKSLLCLGKIVHKLSTNDRWHISYRDSKLTFLLKDSLGGNCKLAIIGNVSLDYPTETINTLEFLKRSKMITNNPSMNYDTAQSSVEELTEKLKALDSENHRLKERISAISQEHKHAVKHSMVFSVRKLKEEVDDVKNTFLELKEQSKATFSSFFDERRKILVEINKNLEILNGMSKENFKNLNVKKKRLS